MSEKRSFTVDPAIIFSIINAQAGTLSKALLEAVMNAVDAGATMIDITLDAARFTCSDNGRGFASRDEILKWFERFGTPHEEGDARFGKFRMGRGQMMAFAATNWETGQFRMAVDIKGRGLDYDLGQLDEPVKGCHIKGKLYDPMSVIDLQATINDFVQLVRFCEIPVKLNGRLISEEPAKLKWDIETEDAYIKLNASTGLKVYNLGVLVREYHSYHTGTGGIVVSKRQLKVNFARNDILINECEVWKRIKQHLTQSSKSAVTRKASLTESEREFLARNILAGGVSAVEALNARVITMATGVHATIFSLLEYRRPREICLAPSDGDRLAERIQRAKAGTVIAPKTLARFGVESLEALLEGLKGAIVQSHRPWPVVVPFESVSSGFSSSYLPVADKDLTIEELEAVRILRKANLMMGNWLEKKTEYATRERDVAVGSSDAALAWTDGTSRITLDRNFLSKSAAKGVDGWFHILMVMLHEYCHTEADLDGHEHPQEFFEAFEDISCAEGNPIGSLAIGAATKFASAMVVAGKKVSAQAAKSVSLAYDKAGKEVLGTAVSVMDGVEPMQLAAKLVPSQK